MYPEVALLVFRLSYHVFYILFHDDLETLEFFAVMACRGPPIAMGGFALKSRVNRCWVRRRSSATPRIISIIELTLIGVGSLRIDSLP